MICNMKKIHKKHCLDTDDMSKFNAIDSEKSTLFLCKTFNLFVPWNRLIHHFNFFEQVKQLVSIQSTHFTTALAHFLKFQ